MLGEGLVDDRHFVSVTEWMSLRQEREKNATCVEQMVTLTRSALKCKKIMLVLRLDLLEIPPMDCLRILEPVASRFRYVCICI